MNNRRTSEAGARDEETTMQKPEELLTRRRVLVGAGGVLGAGVLAACGGGTGKIPTTRAASTSTTGAGTASNAGVDPWHAKVDAAGYVLKAAKVNDVTFSYAEGPDNGPALVLLHAQQMDWFSYSRVLPTLAKSFHVFDVDYQGHGQTETPRGYPMNADRIGADLAAFLERVVREPAYVTGNSSGGLLTTWLAANRPKLVRAALLEDPPLFSSEYPRIKKTVADRDFATSSKAVQQHVDDFLLFWIAESKAFFAKNVGPGAAMLLTQAIKAYRRTHPGQPVELAVVPDDTIRLFLRGMDHQYDPRFGAAFHRGTWNAGFRHAEALERVSRPTMLLQANFTWTDGDVLNGAMSKTDADRAMSLLKHGTYRKIDATHVTHLDEPDEFARILRDFFLVENP